MKALLLYLGCLLCIPAFSQCYESIQAGGFHTIGQQDDRTLWAWGNNTAGQLGIGNLEAQTVPVQINADTDWSKYSVGINNVHAIKDNGTLWAWGNNLEGQLGDGTTNDSSIPIQIGTDTDWQEVSSGQAFTVAIKNDGTLWTWGSNFHNQLGDGTQIDRLNPVMISSDNDWEKVSAGFHHSVALKTDGTLWAWGRNNTGQIGNGDDTNVSTPIQIGDDVDWIDIKTGNDHTIALKEDGTIWSWGDQNFGRLGRPTPDFIDQSTPGQIGSDNDWVSIGCGGNYTMAIKENGSLWNCGENASGALGDGTTDNRGELEQVADNVIWQSIDGGNRHTVALSENTVFLWGNNLGGQIGDGTTDDRLTPFMLNECTLSSDLLEIQKFVVYPNPTLDILNISSDDHFDFYELTLHDLSGKLLMQSKNERKSQLDLASIEAGVYLLVIKTKNGLTSHHRVVKN